MGGPEMAPQTPPPAPRPSQGLDRAGGVPGMAPPAPPPAPPSTPGAARPGRPGDVLYVGPGWYVAVEAASEPVLAVTPRSREEAVRVAFEVGNRHFTLALDGEQLLVPDDPAMDQLLTRLGVDFERRAAVFVPV